MHIHAMRWATTVDHTQAYIRHVSVSCLLIVVPAISAGLFSLLLLKVVLAGEDWACIMTLLNPKTNLCGAVVVFQLYLLSRFAD